MIYVIYCIILPYASFNDSRTNLRISARSFPFHPRPRNTKILGVSYFTQSAFPSSHIDFMKFSGIFNLPFAILTLFPLPPTTGPGMPPSSSTLPVTAGRAAHLVSRWLGKTCKNPKRRDERSMLQYFHENGFRRKKLMTSNFDLRFSSLCTLSIVKLVTNPPKEKPFALADFCRRVTRFWIAQSPRWPQ